MDMFQKSKATFTAIVLGLLLGSLFAFCQLWNMSMDMSVPGSGESVSSSNAAACCGSVYIQNGLTAKVLKDSVTENSAAQKILIFLFIALLSTIPAIFGRSDFKALFVRCKIGLRIPPASYLQLAFSDGLLNTKLYIA